MFLSCKTWLWHLLSSDIIAIPNFAAGAMENWGLVTFRDTALLFDPEKGAARNKNWVAIVVAHELAHQVWVCLFV